MATEVICFVLKKIDELIKEEVKFGKEVLEKLHSLKRRLSLVDSCLRDLDISYTTSPQIMKTWVGQLRDMAYEIEDVIDEFYLEIDQYSSANSKNFFCCAPFGSDTLVINKLGNAILEKSNTLNQIFNERTQLGIEINPREGNAVNSSTDVPLEREKLAIAEGLDVVGFDDVERLMVRQLLNGTDPRTVLSVVGMGGLGKTTIARKLYCRLDVQKHFKRRAWITVSQYYTADELLKSILKCILDCIPTSTRKEKQIVHTLQYDELKIRLQNLLKKHIYLVVIDDIWQKEAWDKIRDVLPLDSEGSKVILTTRINEVARYARDERGYIYELPFLTDDQSWELFCKKVFHSSSCPHELESLGKDMVVKCGGLPLAIIVLGGLVCSRPNWKQHQEWQKLRDHVTHELSNERGKMIKKILALSYNDLSYDLKLCFLYIGIFPEDVEIDAVKLTHLWIAEGFINKVREKTIEEAAEGHLEELANRSIIQVVERNPLGQVAKCRIHDLLLELAYTVGQENRILDAHRSQIDSGIVRSQRLAVHYLLEECSMYQNSINPHLRTLMCFNQHQIQESISFLLVRLTWLRVLDLEGAPLEALPSEIGGMRLLKYLGLRRTKLKSIPDTIGKLHKLETLNVMDIDNLLSLPKVVWKMKQLRHLHISSVKPPQKICDLINLQTLETACADKWILSSLGKLSSLRKLGINTIADIHKNALADSVQKLIHLKSLTLSGILIPNVFDMDLEKHVGLLYLSLMGEMNRFPKKTLSSGMNLPPNLTQITLEESKLQIDPLQLLEQLPGLCILRLLSNSSIREEINCSAMGFPQLKELYLGSLESLRRWNMANGGMRCLESLNIHYCRKLETLPEAVQHVTTLRQISFSSMPSSFLMKFDQGGEDWYKIEHVQDFSVT